MLTRKVLINVFNSEFECDLIFNYSPAVPANLFALPENCHPGEEEEFELVELTYEGVDLTFMLDDIEDDIIDQLKSMGDDE